MTFFDWHEARERAKAGRPVRRYGWLDRWLQRRAGNLWWIVPHSRVPDPSLVPPERVVRSGDFGLEEFFAEDWTEDAPEANNVCTRPDRPAFVPPGVGFTAWIGENSLTLAASLGSGSRPGIYGLVFYVDGAEVARREAVQPGNYEVEVPADLADGRWTCTVEVTSMLPLPRWSTRRERVLEMPPLAFEEIDLALAFPVNARPWWDTPAGRRSLWDGGQRVYGPWPEPRWVYTHADDLAFADDDLILNEIWINPTGSSGPVYPVTTLLLYLPPGVPLSVDVNNTAAMTGCHTDGALRVYNRPL